MNAKPLDSCVSGLRITFTLSATRFSAVSHDLISSAVTHRGRFPRNTVKLIPSVIDSVGIWEELLRGHDPLGSTPIVSRDRAPRKRLSCRKYLLRERLRGPRCARSRAAA